MTEPTNSQLNRVKELIKRKFNKELSDEEILETYFSMILLGRAMARYLRRQKIKHNEKIKTSL
jgi:hypothetical protein